MKGKIMLAGGGGAEDSLLLDKKLASWIGRRGKMLFLPIAFQDPNRHKTSMAWIAETFSPLGVENIRMWSNLAEHNSTELFEFDAVYIGGGNTYWLLAQIVESGFDHHLVNFVRAGGIVYGGSAGAAILGRDIQTVKHLDRNDIDLTETRGLDLADGYSVWVHYQEEDDQRIREYMNEKHHSVIAISERSGVVMDDTGIQSVGYEPAYYFNKNEKRQI
ncbi:MAG: Type 1 glutamine amidotransferase-like domain-containing protein [Anaerolineales bacterium]